MQSFRLLFSSTISWYKFQLASLLFFHLIATQFSGRSDLEAILTEMLDYIFTDNRPEPGSGPGPQLDFIHIFLNAANFSNDDGGCAMSFEDFKRWCTLLPSVRKFLGSLLTPSDPGFKFDRFIIFFHCFLFKKNNISSNVLRFLILKELLTFNFSLTWQAEDGNSGHIGGPGFPFNVTYSLFLNSKSPFLILPGLPYSYASFPCIGNRFSNSSSTAAGKFWF